MRVDGWRESIAPSVDSIGEGGVGDGAEDRGVEERSARSGAFAATAPGPGSGQPLPRRRSDRRVHLCAQSALRSVRERPVHEVLRGLLHLGEVLLALEGLGVDLVDVLGARGARREPGGLGGDLQPADRAASLTRDQGEGTGDRFAYRAAFNAAKAAS